MEDDPSCIRAARDPSMEAKGASNEGGRSSSPVSPAAKRSIQRTEPISCSTCQKQARRPITKTKRMNPFSQGLASNTGSTRGSATKAPKPDIPNAISIMMIWRTGCENCGRISRSGCAMR